MAREETEMYIQYLSAVLPFLKDQKDVFISLKEMLLSASNLRWLREDNPTEVHKNYETVKELVAMLHKKIGEKQNGRVNKNKDNAVED